MTMMTMNQPTSQSFFSKPSWEYSWEPRQHCAVSNRVMQTPKPSITNIIKSLFIGLVFCTLQLSLSLPMPPRYATRRASRLSAKVKVTTYNVLSSHLAAPSWFPACNPEYLAPKYRFESLKKKLDEECESNAVICLQELSHTWAGPLHSFFANRGYHVVNALYGNRMNNYMGVALAIPLDKYDILDVNIQKVSDTKIMPRKPKLTSFQEVLRQIQGVFIKLAIFFKLYRPPFDVWDNVLYRHNQMVCARLQDKESGKSFVVGTYHMPCMFDKPAVMVTHTSLSAKHILRYAEQVSADDSSGEPVVDPVIFCGDYNFKPGSSEYELITKGQLDEKHPNQPPAVPGDSWTTTLPTAFASAYATKLGTEPDFTNYAKVQQQPEFIDTLDYIFYSPKEGIEVESVRPLPHRSEVRGPLPNRDEPSDHILLSATFNLH